MRSVTRYSIFALALLAAGCVSLAEGTAQAPIATQTPLPPLESPTPLELVPTVEPSPTINPDLQRIFITYQHPTNVFSASLPETWAARDDSTDDRLLVTLEPPLGFASRISVDITYESDLTLDEMAALREGYLDLFYANDENYTEINRAELADGRLQVTYLYNNPAGASGRETVYLSQNGPYFSALRAFISDNDVLALSGVIEQVVESFTVNPTARWGEAELAVNPEDLQVQGLYGWFDGDGNYRVMGRLFNAWQEDVARLALKASVCDPNGIVLDENEIVLVNDVLPVGGVVPFQMVFGPIDEPEPRPCLVQPRAEPASLLDLDTYDTFEVTNEISYNVEADTAAGEPVLTVSGTVLNTGPETVHLIDIIIAVYDGSFDAPDTHVIGYAVTTPDAAQLGPGEASQFRFDFGAGELGGIPVEVELWRQANPLAPTPATSPTPTG